MTDPYVYPGTEVLRNKLDIRDGAALDRVERRLVSQRILDGVPKGRFDAAHLRAIHHHLFQDVYEWAGEFRTLNISKGGSHFHNFRRLDMGIDQVHRQVKAAGTMRSLSRVKVAVKLAIAIGDLNYVHPFREGNGRTQLQYARLLAERAGLRLEVSRLSGPEWIRASAEAMEKRGGTMVVCFNEALLPRERERRPERDRDREP